MWKLRSFSFHVFPEQQVMELQELYDSQQFLTAELSEKLERTEVLWIGD